MIVFRFSFRADSLQIGSSVSRCDDLLHRRKRPAEPGISIEILRFLEGGIFHVHAEEEALDGCERLADIVKAERRIRHRMVMTDAIGEPGSRVRMCRCLRDHQRLILAVVIADFQKFRNVDIRTEHVNARRSVTPHFMHPRDRTAARILARHIVLMNQPAVGKKRQIIFLFSHLGDVIHETGYMIGTEDLFRRLIEDFFPASAFLSFFHGCFHVFLHRSRMASHIRNEGRRNIRCKSRIRFIGNFPGIPQQAGLVFHLDTNDSPLFFVIPFQMPHESGESFSIRFHRLFA